jgi:tetratricopeptide (TPR) repeat protein
VRWTAFVQRALRLGLIAVLGFWPALPGHAREPAQPTLLDSFLAVDAGFLDAGQVAAARSAFKELIGEASPCGADPNPSHDRARCVVDALFASGELETVAEIESPESSTVTSALVSRRGNCAGLTALVLAVAERVDVPMEAVVFPSHVVVRAPGTDDHVFELLQRGARLSMTQLRAQLGAEGAHDTRVRSEAFPAFYLDNFGVRFSEAGNGDRAEALFASAIEAAPRVSRIRFDYGTFLLGTKRFALAKEQLRRAVRLDSRNAPAWVNLGVSLARLGDTAKALRCFGRALRFDPGNRIAVENLRILGHEKDKP